MHPVSVKTAGKDLTDTEIARRIALGDRDACELLMRRSKIVWSGKTLDRFLANPLKAVPGTAMGYAGITDRKERADLIAYLEQANASPECHRQPHPLQ